MDVHRAIEERRAYRSLEAVDVTAELIIELAQASRLAPSCMNNQPWRFIFIHGPEQIGRVKETLSRGNRWATEASMIIAVLSQPELDCRSRGRDFFMFDTGMATEARRTILEQWVGPDYDHRISDNMADNLDLLREVAESNAEIAAWWENNKDDLDADEAEAQWRSYQPSGFVYPLEISGDYEWDVGPDLF